eukprot:3941687-Rhodomonas_salina.1
MGMHEAREARERARHEEDGTKRLLKAGLTLHPAPCTLTLDPDPRLWTLHPTPYTLHPAPYTLHPSTPSLRLTLPTARAHRSRSGPAARLRRGLPQGHPAPCIPRRPRVSSLDPRPYLDPRP